MSVWLLYTHLIFKSKIRYGSKTLERRCLVEITVTTSLPTVTERQCSLKKYTWFLCDADLSEKTKLVTLPGQLPRLVECCFTSTETIDLLGTGSPGRTPRLSHSSWALNCPHNFWRYIWHTVGRAYGFSRARLLSWTKPKSVWVNSEKLIRPI